MVNTNEIRNIKGVKVKKSDLLKTIDDGENKMRYLADENEKLTHYNDELIKDCDRLSDENTRLKAELAYEREKTAKYLEELGKVRAEVDDYKAYYELMCNMFGAMNAEVNIYKDTLIDILGIKAKKEATNG